MTKVKVCKKHKILPTIFKERIFKDGSKHTEGYCNICKKKIGIVKNMEYPDNDNFIMPFGKYLGKSITEIVDIDKNYVNWILDIPDFDKNIKTRFKEALALEKEVNKLLYQSLYNDL